MRIASTNATLGGNIQELLDAPIRVGSGPTVYLRDVGTINDATDIIVGYAHVERQADRVHPGDEAGRRLHARRDSAASGRPCRRCEASRRTTSRSTWCSTSPATCVSALNGCVGEALLGAVLTGLMVLLFLRDWRSSLIVVITIPFALLSAVVALWLTGQTINIMTLGGLALAVGVLVDEATVEIENIHTTICRRPVARSRGARGSGRRPRPRLLAMLCVLAVFIPSFFMAGVGRSFRAAVAGRRLRDDRVVHPLQHAGAGALDLAAARRPRRDRGSSTAAIGLPGGASTRLLAPALARSSASTWSPAAS